MRGSTDGGPTTVIGIMRKTYALRVAYNIINIILLYILGTFVDRNLFLIIVTRYANILWYAIVILCYLCYCAHVAGPCSFPL